MKTFDVTLLPVMGLAIWVAGTVYYAYVGPIVRQTTTSRYWISFILSPLFSAAICIAILRWCHIPPGAWASAILLLPIPGMIGEAAALSNLTTLMPRLHTTSGGRYGAFLFATYALVLGVAEVVTLRTAR